MVGIIMNEEMEGGSKGSGQVYFQVLLWYYKKGLKKSTKYLIQKRRHPFEIRQGNPPNANETHCCRRTMKHRDDPETLARWVSSHRSSLNRREVNMETGDVKIKLRDVSLRIFRYFLPVELSRKWRRARRSQTES